MRPLLRFSKGLTIVELMISIGALSLLLTIIIQFISSSWKTNNLLATKAYLKSYTQNAINRMSGQISQAKMLLGDGGLGTAYANKLDLSNSPTPIPGHRTK